MQPGQGNTRIPGSRVTAKEIREIFDVLKKIDRNIQEHSNRNRFSNQNPYASSCRRGNNGISQRRRPASA